MDFLKRLWPFKQPRSGPQLATEQDVYYCYRLFLHREPDPEGFAYWKRVAPQRMTLRDLTYAFMQSNEFKMLLDSYNQIELVDLEHFSIYVNPDDYSVGGIVKRQRSYEPAVTAELRRLLKPGQTFIDIGANIGYLSLHAAERVGPNGRVISFEPNKENCQLLAKSIEINGFTNIELHQLAVDAQRQTLRLTSPSGSSNGRILSTTEQTSDEVTVEAVALDEFLPPLAQVDLVKLDIEGAEPRALAGMRQLLAQHRPTLIFEFTPQAIRTLCGLEPKVFLQQLESDYQLFILDPTYGRSAPTKANDIVKTCERAGAGEHVDILAVPL